MTERDIILTLANNARVTVCTILNAMTGGDWRHTTIRGVCQGDWQTRK